MVSKNIRIENARIGFRNFTGVEGKFNPPGRKNFCVFLEPDIGAALEIDGWNVRWLDPRDETEGRTPYLSVAVSYENIPPKIVLVTDHGKTILDENTVHILDWAEIENVDLVIRPYNWEVNGKGGVKAYIKSLFVKIVEDEFETKYANVPDSAVNVMKDPDAD